MRIKTVLVAAALALGAAVPAWARVTVITYMGAQEFEDELVRWARAYLGYPAAGKLSAPTPAVPPPGC